MMRFEYTYNQEAIQNLNYIQSAVLQNRGIVEVYIDGMGRSKIIEGDIPYNQEVEYNAALGKITFPAVLPQYTKIVVLYQSL
jgi:hypothetical protein